MSGDPTVRVNHDGDIVWITIDNPPVNATSQSVRAGLEQAVSEVASARVAILICEGATFVAGGDMSEFDAPPALPHLPDVLSLIEHSKTPFIAAMHGNVLGGGLEIALGCTWRIALPTTRFGLPEVNVGLIPGAGGTQRLPRLVGMDLALDMAAGGQIVNAKTMLQAGGIDQIVEGDLRAQVAKFAATLPARPTPISDLPVPAATDEALEAKRAQILKRARGQQAPRHNIEALEWAHLPFAEGQKKERARHLELRKSPESRALRHAFFAERQVAKPAALSGGTPRDVNNIAVVGGGLMGAGIATALLGAGFGVTIIEQTAEAAHAGQTRVFTNLDGAFKRGKIDAQKLADQKSRLTVSTDYAAAAGHDLAIEAVFEDVSVKQEVFAKLAAVMDADAILATNTSYLDPRDIFDGIAHPERCIGLHFFSPAHIMKLLEIVRLPDTSANTLATGFSIGKRLRKVAVLSGICDGFIGNRMLAAYRREAEYLLADGAMPHQIDDAMRTFGFAMGPFQAQDMGGLQIAWSNRKAQAASRDPAQRYVTIADALCETGRFGQRSNGGWYDYPDGPRSMAPSTTTEAVITDYSKREGIERRAFSAADITDRLLAVLANEGALIVEDGIAENDAAIDMVKLHGYGFPRWRGGPMHYSNEIGAAKVAATMKTIASESPNSWRIAKKFQI